MCIIYLVIEVIYISPALMGTGMKSQNFHKLQAQKSEIK